jgi:hypothetical protein
MRSDSRLAEICGSGGIFCSKNRDRVYGDANDADMFFDAQQICQESRACNFSAKLSPDAMSSLEVAIKEKIGSRAEINVTPGGIILIRIACAGSELKVLRDEFDGMTGGLITKRHATIICRDTLEPRKFRLRSKVVVIDGDENREFGAPNWSIGKIISPTEPARMLKESDFMAVIKSDRVRIVGEPMIRFLEGREATVESGGEIPFVTASGQASENRETQWKQYGLALKVTASAKNESEILLTLDFAVRNPSGESGRTGLSLNRIAADLELKIGEPAVVGGVELATGGEKTRAIPIVSEIPIIGPLFRFENRVNGKSKLFLWLCIDDDNGKLEPPMINDSPLPSLSQVEGKSTILKNK